MALTTNYFSDSDFAMSADTKDISRSFENAFLHPEFFKYSQETFEAFLEKLAEKDLATAAQRVEAEGVESILRLRPIAAKNLLIFLERKGIFLVCWNGCLKVRKKLRTYLSIWLKQLFLPCSVLFRNMTW